MSTLPVCEHTERAVLGCILSQPAIAMPVCVQQVTPAHFLIPAHATIYAALSEMWAADRKIDSITATAFLADRGVLATIGGPAKVTELFLYVPTAILLPDYLITLREKFVARRLVALCTQYQNRALENDEPTELLNELQSELLSLGTGTTKTEVSVRQLVDSAMEELESAKASEGKAIGLSTGLIDLDFYFGGMRPGQLIVIAADTAKGTTLALNIAEHVAVKLEKPCGVVSLEMSGVELVNRMIASVGKVDLHQWISRKDEGDDDSERYIRQITNASGRVAAAPLFIRDDSDVDALKLRGIGRQLKHEHAIELLIVDYVQLLMPGNVKDENRERAMATAAQALKQMAKELQIVVIVLSQVNESGRLRESRAIGHHADKVITISHDDSQPGAAFLHIDKNRSGPTGTVAVTFQAEFTRFCNNKKAA